MKLLYRISKLLPLFLICSIAFAESPRVYPQQGVLNFRGLDNKSSPTAVQDGRASDLLNVKFDATGALIKRYGYSMVGDILDEYGYDFEAIQGIHYVKYSSSTEEILAVCGGRFYLLDSAADPDTWTFLNAGGTTGDNYQYVFTTALDTVIATNDQDTVFKHTEAGTFTALDLSDLTDTVTKVKTLIWHKNYLILGNVVEAGTDYATRIRWSTVGFIETWDDDDFIDIEALGGEEIEAMAILYDNLYVFFTDSIYQVSLVGGDAIWKVTKVIDGIGCIAKNSVQHIILGNQQQGLIFLTQDKKIYFFNGLSTQYISILIENTMDDLVASRLPYAVSAEDGNDYYLGISYSGATENNLILDFQYQLGEWSKFDQLDANAMTRVYDADGLNVTYFGQYAGYVCELDDSSTSSDVEGATGTVTGPIANVDTYHTDTASGLQVVWDATASFTASGMRGAILKINSGTGNGQERRIIDNTTTGIIVETAFSTTPDDTSAYSVGAIDGYFTSKWYDCGNPAQIKSFGELYWWADVQAAADIDVTYATDFSSDIETQAVSLAGDATDAIWGSSVWGTAYWGGTDAIFRQTKFQNSGRYLKFKFQNDDIDEWFKIYGCNVVFWGGEIN